MQKLFEIVVEQLIRFFAIKHVAIFKIVPSDVELSLAHSSGFKEESVHGLERLMPEEGVLRRLLDTRIPQIVNEISQTEKSLYFLAENEGLSSMIAVPIYAGEKPWGILTAFSQEASRFREEDGKIVSLFAGQIGQLLQVFAQHLRDNLDDLLVQILGSIELMNLRYQAKESIPASEIFHLQERLRKRMRWYVADFEPLSADSEPVETEAKGEKIKLPSGDELSIEEVVTVQGEKGKAATKMKKVLVIDDQPIVTDLLESVLERMNYHAVVAACGKDGLAAFGKDDFDMVITDLGMPDVSGWDVSKAVKQKKPSVPVVVITGWGVTPDPDRMKDSKVDRVINKPFQIDQLEKIIKDLLQQ